MSDSKKYYCFCSSNCKYETMTKEQILAAIAQAVETGSVGDVDTGFVTKIKETNSGDYVTFWVGTQAQYNAIATKAKNCMYIITDDTQGADIAKALAAATQAANDAAAIVGNAKNIDISSRITLTEKSRPSNITAVEIWRKKYVYSPAVGAVFFELSIAFKGTFAGGELIRFTHSGGYTPEETGGVPVVCRGSGYRAEYSGNEIWIDMLTEGEYDDAWSEAYLSGWYFCNGEG